MKPWMRIFPGDSGPQASAAPIDPAECAVLDITDGGGNTFDCYADGNFTESTPEAGTGLGDYKEGGTGEPPAFDSSACAVTTIPDGGGNTFDCYENGEFSESLPNAGSGYDNYFVGDSPFDYVYGDPFEEYADGAYAGGTPGVGSTGYVEIFIGDGP